MTQDPQADGPSSDFRKQELLAGFLLAEFNSLVDRARDFDQMNSSRTNFFLIIVAAVGAGLGGATGLQLSASNYVLMVLLAIAALLILGAVTFYYSIRASIAMVSLYRLAGRVRCWFADLAPEAVPYFPFGPGDNRPLYTTRFWTFRVGEPIVATVNSVLASGGVALIVYQLFATPWVVLPTAIVVWALVWFLQRKVINWAMKRAEVKHWPTDVHFPREAYQDLYSVPQGKRPTTKPPER
jgi:hypothetical protein